MYGLPAHHYPFQTIHDESYLQQSGSTSSSSSSTGSPCPRPSISKVPTHYAPYGFSGDGWGQLLLPIPSNEDPYKFLQKIQDEWERQSALIALKKGGKHPGSRSTFHSTSPCLSSGRIDEDQVGKWECFLKLPKEVWNDIAQYLCDSGDGYSLACTSKAFNKLVCPLLYTTPILKSLSSLNTFLETMTSYANGTNISPLRPSAITSLSLQLTSIDWDRAEELGRILQVTGADIKTLKVECAGSDLERARSVFSKFDPQVFEWHTAPCWLVRPANVFEQILLGWPKLHTLKLSGFFWDASLMSTFFDLPNLRTLHLSGRTMSSLSWDSLRDLLEPPATNSSSSPHCLKLDEIHLSGLPPGKASTFDDENAALQKLSGSYFASRGSTRDGSLSPSLLAGSALSTSVPNSTSSAFPMAPMIRSSSLDAGIEASNIQSGAANVWPWQCENKDYGKHHEGKGSMIWMRNKQQKDLTEDQA